jgi:PST family polysaccharide transporter
VPRHSARHAGGRQHPRDNAARVAASAADARRRGDAAAQADKSGDKPARGDKNSLAGRASRALSWSFMSNALARLGTVGIGITLARLLGPHAFGTYAVAYVALIAVLSFNELGVSLAIVRWQGEPREITPTVTTISLVTSIAIYVGCFAGAPAYAAAMGAPSATGVIRVLALNVVIDGAVSTPAALLQRHFQQGKKAITDQVNCWLGAGLTIALAWYGFGAMSLAIGRLAGCLAGGILLVVFSPEPLRLGFDRVKARALLRFGLPLGGASLIVFAVLNVDQVVVGHLLGATALGCYVLAFNLSGWPGNIFSQPVRTVAPAVFSRLQHDRAARSAYFLNIAGLLGAVALPVCVLLSGSAVPLIGFVYGGRWMPAAQALIWLGLLAALRIFFELVYDYFVVLAKSRVVLVVQLVWLVALTPALIVGAHADGIFGAGLAGVAVAAGVILPWYLIELKSVGIRLRSLAGRLWLPFTGAAAAGLAAMAARKVAPTDLTALLISGFATVFIMALLVYRMRATLALLRHGPAQEAGPDPAEAAAQARASQQEEALALLMSLARPRPVHEDVTGPIPAYNDSVEYLQPRYYSRPRAPLYQQAAPSTRRNQAAPPHANGRGTSPSRPTANGASQAAPPHANGRGTSPSRPTANGASPAGAGRPPARPPAAASGTAPPAANGNVPPWRERGDLRHRVPLADLPDHGANTEVLPAVVRRWSRRPDDTDPDVELANGSRRHGHEPR